MTYKKFTFIVVQTGTILAILAFAIIFHQALFGSPTVVDAGIVVKKTRVANVSSKEYGLPLRLTIPAISVDAKVQQVGLTATGNMGIPTNFTDVGWYKHGTIPGETGSAVIAGHVDNALGLKGVFKYLDDLKKGDDVYVKDVDGSIAHFKVIDVALYPYDKAPAEEIFNESERTLLRLITCGGKWIRSAKTYDTRIVVTAEYVPS